MQKNQDNIKVLKQFYNFTKLNTSMATGEDIIKTPCVCRIANTSLTFGDLSMNSEMLTFSVSIYIRAKPRIVSVGHAAGAATSRQHGGVRRRLGYESRDLA